MGGKPELFVSVVSIRQFVLSGVKHRNSLETWSSVPLLMNSASESYDFSTGRTRHLEITCVICLTEILEFMEEILIRAAL